MNKSFRRTLVGALVVNTVVTSVAISGYHYVLQAAQREDLNPQHPQAQCMVQFEDFTWAFADCPPGRIGGFVPYTG